MKTERLENSLKGIQNLLSHLTGEVSALEASYSQVLQVLRKLEAACEIDDLSKLLRRRPFFQKWEGLLEECKAVGEDCGVLLIDIDHFKKINDTHGHPTGDEVIKRVAGILKRFESDHCVVGRYGGEEFAVAARGSEAEILGLAEQIRQETESLGSTDTTLGCTVSVGAAAAGVHGFDSKILISAADEALYEAKNCGRNRVKAA